MNENNAIQNMLSTDSIKAIVANENVENILLKNYGLLNPKIKVLNGYDDRNFKIKVDKLQRNSHLDYLCEDGYVLKVINSLDSKNLEFFKAQDSVLIYLGERQICCPRPVKTRTGQYLTLENLKSGKHIVRLLEFIPGNILAEVKCTPKICYECGAFVGNLNENLKNFSHMGYENHSTPWMMTSIPQLHQILYVVKNAERQNLVKEVISEFSLLVLSKYDSFEKGLIHGDFNEQNILMDRKDDGDWHVKGVLDFGDSHIGPFLFELAITMMYIIVHAQDIGSGGYALAGYSSIRTLSIQELELLKICVCARLCQSLTLGTFTLSRDPDNIYVAQITKVGWSILKDLWEIPDKDILNQWLNIGANLCQNNETASVIYNDTKSK